MNLHVITPSDLLKFQIEHYSEMLENPRSFEHKIFLRKQLKQLQNDIPVNTILHNKCYSNHFSNILSQRLERI
jgi:hypothetical protein